MKAFLPRHLRRCDRAFWPHKRLLAHLTSRKAIMRHVRSDREAIPHATTLHTSLRGLPWPTTLAEAQLVIYALEEQRDVIQASVRAHHNLLDRQYRGGCRKPPHRITGDARRRVVRAALFAASLLGSQTVSAFARGQPVTIPGNAVNIEARLTGSLTTVGHGAMTLALTSPDGTRLANLCAYFDETPVLDQLAALHLHVSSGGELDVLATGNLYAVTEAGAAHPLILDKPTALDAFADIIRGARAAGVTTDDIDRVDLQDAADRRYTAAYLDRYVEATEVVLWGRDVGRYRRLVATLSTDGSIASMDEPLGINQALAA